MNRVKGFVTAAAVASIVGVPLAVGAQQPEQRQPAEQAQSAQAAQASATATGELVRVDVRAKTLAVKATDGREMSFSFTDETKISGASSPAGLATMEGAQVTVRYAEKDRVATDIQISPKK